MNAHTYPSLRRRVRLETKADYPRYETKSDMSEDVARIVSDISTGFDEFRRKSDEKIHRLEREIGALETAFARTPRGGDVKHGDEPSLEAKAFDHFLRGGADKLGPDERKALVSGDNTAGGYLAPSEVSTEVLKNLVEFSPVRAAARVGNMSAREILIPRRTGRPTAHWVGETQERQGTESAYGQLMITAHEMACYVDVSNALLEDASVNLANEIAADLAEEFGRLEGLAFVSGDGINKPFGLMQDTTVPEVVSGNASAITSDSLIDLVYSLPAFYRRGAGFMMNSTTAGAVRKLKNGQGDYLWRDGLAEGQPATLLGFPVVEAVDMPNVAANAFPIMFGNYQQGYRIMDRVGLIIRRDDFTRQHVGQVRFHARRRVGGATTKTEALRKLKIAEA